MYILLCVYYSAQLTMSTDQQKQGHLLYTVQQLWYISILNNGLKHIKVSSEESLDLLRGLLKKKLLPPNRM